MVDDTHSSHADFDDNPKERLTTTRAFYLILKYLFIDIIWYGSVFPFIGVYCTYYISNFLSITGQWEVAIGVFLTFSLLYLSFWVICVEHPFWKHFLAMDKFYLRLLKLRDAVNTVTLIVCIIYLHQLVILMTKTTKSSLKERNLGEGVGSLYFNIVFGYLRIDQALLSKTFQKDKLEYDVNVEYIFYWSMLAASVAKLVYFNALLTMLRSMEIFIALRPLFMDEKEYDNSIFNRDYKSVNFTVFEKSVHTPKKFRSKDTLAEEAKVNQYSYIS